MDKYYVPEINEFFVGFEFEERHTSNSKEWRSRILEKVDLMSWEGDSGISEIVYGLSTCIRVKFLDRDDIESFGFNYSNSIHTGSLFKRGDYALQLMNQEDRGVGVIIAQYDYVTSVLFQGRIKNKSALKLLLTQLGI